MTSMNTAFPNTPVKQFHYAPMNERYHEFVVANIMITNAMGPAHPGASFTLFGDVLLKADRQLEISATALTEITRFARRVTFQVTASVMKNGVPVCPAQTVKRHHDAYIHDSCSIVIGEAFFVLPEPLDPQPLTLALEGTYFANFDEGIGMPRRILGLDTAYVRKNFTIMVLEDTL